MNLSHDKMNESSRTKTRRGAHSAGPLGEPRWAGYLYIAPLFVIYGLFFLIPLARLTGFSFYEWNGLGAAEWVGIDNYLELFSDPDLLAPFARAGVLIVFFAVLPVAIGLVLAAVVSRHRLPGLGFFRSVLFLPQVIAMVVVAAAWIYIYAPGGTINTILRFFGLDDWARPWLGDYSFALVAVGLIGTWVGTGLTFILFLAGVAKIPREQYEAARVDGAGPIREFFAVTVPAVRYEMSVALTLTVISALRTFDVIYVTTKGGPGHETLVPAFQMFRQAFELGQVGSAATLAVVLTLVIFVLSFFITRVAERGEQS